MFRRSQPSERKKPLEALQSITLDGVPLGVEALRDLTEAYSWKGRSLKELRWAKPPPFYDRIVNQQALIQIGDDTYQYAGSSGFDGQAYFILVERVERVRRPAETPLKQPMTPLSRSPEARREESVVPRVPEVVVPPPAAQAARPAEVVTPPVPRAIPSPPEGEAAPPSPAERVERGPAPGDMAGLEQSLAELLKREHRAGGAAKPKTEVPDYSHLTVEEYEAMSAEEASKVPPEVVQRLYGQK